MRDRSAVGIPSTAFAASVALGQPVSECQSYFSAAVVLSLAVLTPLALLALLTA